MVDFLIINQFIICNQDQRQDPASAPFSIRRHERLFSYSGETVTYNT
jgi:hypothetical protein